MANKRILDETTASVAASDDYLYIDGATNGSRKITPENIVLNSTTAQLLAQHISDATQEVTDIQGDISDLQDDITDLRSDIGDLSELDTTDKSSIVNAINEVAGGSGSGVPTTVRSAMLTLFEAAAYAETGLTDEIAVIESWAEAVTEITLNNSTISISGSGTSQLTATTVPSGATVSWSSSNTAVATVSSSGLVTGVSNGTATITASAGDMSATCTATVSGFATLTSISAVYTQSGTVYDTDTLDSLKTDLVVTAHYDNSTTSTIASTDYTLSGTLAEGTSTITVAYGGKTTTFTVTVSHLDNSVYNWDFTQSLIDSKQGAEAVLGANCTRNENGLVFQSSANSYAYLCNLSAYNANPCTIEVDVTSIVVSPQNYNTCFVLLSSGTTGARDHGLEWKYGTTQWVWRYSNTEIVPDTPITDSTIFNNSTVKIQIDLSNQQVRVYKNNTLMMTFTLSGSTLNNKTYLTLGANSQARTMQAGTYITGVRVYEGIV